MTSLTPYSCEGNSTNSIIPKETLYSLQTLKYAQTGILTLLQHWQHLDPQSGQEPAHK